MPDRDHEEPGAAAQPQVFTQDLVEEEVRVVRQIDDFDDCADAFNEYLNEVDAAVAQGPAVVRQSVVEGDDFPPSPSVDICLDD